MIYKENSKTNIYKNIRLFILNNAYLDIHWNNLKTKEVNVRARSVT